MLHIVFATCSLEREVRQGTKLWVSIGNIRWITDRYSSSVEVGYSSFQVVDGLEFMLMHVRGAP